MSQVSEVGYAKSNTKNLSVEEIGRKIEIQKEIKNNKVFRVLKESLLGVVEKWGINNPDHWNIIGGWI